MVYINAIASYKTLTTDIKDLIPDANSRRRMSRVVKMGVATAVECARQMNVAELDAIITATGLGCLDDSEKFLKNVLDSDEQLLAPTAFIQSTFNTVGGILGCMFGAHVYNMTYTHRGRSFESALLDAVLQIEAGEAQNVLLCAFDDCTETQKNVMQRLGWLRHAEAGSGAYAFWLSSKKTEKTKVKVFTPTFVCNKLDINKLKNEKVCISVFDVATYGVCATASAAHFFDALHMDAKEILLYNEFLGGEPTLVRLKKTE